MSTALSPLEQLEQQSSQGQPQQAAQPASGLSPLEQLEQMSSPKQQPSGTPAEQGFLAKNPDYQWVSSDPSKPNTQPGIYHKSEVADMVKDPTMEHHPVDLQFAKHTAEGAGQAALATGGPIATGMAVSAAGPIAETLAGHMLERGTAFAAKYPNIVTLAGKLGWKAPASTIGALLLAYEHFKK